MIGPERAAEIRRLFFAEHFKVGTIVSQLGEHPDVVKRVLGQMGRPRLDKPSTDGLLEPYQQFISDTLESYPRLRATRIYDMIVGRGYTGSVRTLRRYVTQVRPVPRGEVFMRIETLPGEQAQVDWGQVGSIPVTGGERKLWVFVMVLSYSRALWAELVFDLGVYSLLRSLVRAAEYFGGVTRQWLFDNPKTVVVERRGDAVRYQRDLLQLAAELNVQPRLCAVRKPNQKGAVERAVRYLKERFFAAREIYSIEQGNEQLMQFIDDISMQRQHPVHCQRTVQQVFEQDEQPHLLSLPDVMPSTNQLVTAIADKTAFIRFDNNRYSVPPEYARSALTISASDTVLSIIDKQHKVAEHRRCWGRGQWVQDAEHHAKLLQQKRAARDSKGRDRLREQVPGIDALLQQWADQGQQMGSQVARTVKLLELYGPAVLSQALEELTEHGSCDYGALALLCDKHRGTNRVVMPLEFSSHVKDRDVIAQDLGVYDE